MTIYVSSQMPHLHRLFLAPILGMPEGRIRVIVPDVGGAFGLKCTIYPEDAVIPAVARRLGRPVKWIEDRWENLATGVHSKGMVCTMDIAADADGTFRGFRAHFITDGGGYSSVPFTPVVDSQCAAGLLPSCYASTTSPTRSTTRSRTSARSGPSAASAGCPASSSARPPSTTSRGRWASTPWSCGCAT